MTDNDLEPVRWQVKPFHEPMVTQFTDAYHVFPGLKGLIFFQV